MVKEVCEEAWVIVGDAAEVVSYHFTLFCMKFWKEIGEDEVENHSAIN